MRKRRISVRMRRGKPFTPRRTTQPIRPKAARRRIPECRTYVTETHYEL